jgi:microcystin-dependent protein
VADPNHPSPTEQFINVLTNQALAIINAFNSVFNNAAGGSVGLVPNPSLPIGTTRFLREDATWVAITQLTQVGLVEWWASNILQPGRLKANGALQSRTTFASLFAFLVQSATVTISIAAPGVVTWNNHPFSANDVVKFYTTGALPTGLTPGTPGLPTVGTVYYVVGASITTNTFQVSATPGGSAITTTGTQSGVQTAVGAPWGDGDGSTTFNLPDLRGNFARAWDDSAGVDPSRTFGSQQLDAMQGHVHNGTFAFANIAQAGSGTNAFTGGQQATSGPVTDGSHGTPRTASETRPINYALMPTIRYQ